jgi:hypothetical protein
MQLPNAGADLAAVLESLAWYFCIRSLEPKVLLWRPMLGLKSML